MKLVAGRDSLRLACWNGVVDLDRTDALLDFDRPEIDVAQPATGDQAEAAKLPLERGCDATVATVRHVLDPGKRRFVPTGPAKVATVHGLCPCPRP